MLAREHNDANVVSVGGRMHPLEEMTRFVEVFLDTPFSHDERHVRRIAQMLGATSRPGTCRRCPPPRPAPAMPEGHTLRRLADDLAGGVRRAPGPGVAARRAGSPPRPPCSTAPCWWTPTPPGKHLFVEFEGERFVHVHLGPDREVRRRTPAVPPLPVGQVRLRLAAPGRRRTPTCAARPGATWSPWPSRRP